MKHQSIRKRYDYDMTFLDFCPQASHGHFSADTARHWVVFVRGCACVQAVSVVSVHVCFAGVSSSEGDVEGLRVRLILDIAAVRCV